MPATPGPATPAPSPSPAPAAKRRPPWLRRLLKATTFRFALIYLGLFSGSVMLVLWLVYASTAGFLAQQADGAIRDDMTALADRYRVAGLPGLAEAMADRAMGTISSVYLLALPSGTALAGNVPAWPKGAENDGWVTLAVRDRATGAIRPGDVRALVATLPGGYRVLVGRDLGEVRVFRARLEQVIAWGTALALVLGLAGGIIISRTWLRRLDGVTRTAEGIRGGMLVSRVPLNGSGDEFDQLAQTLNAMLDRIEDLVGGIRHVSQGIAHDLRTPLTRLRTRLELALMADPQETPREVLEGAIEEVDHLLATFRALLAIAEVESGGGLSTGPVRLDEVARRMAELYEAVAESQGIAFTLHPLPPVTVTGNEQLLAQALANLLDNAVKYSAPTPADGAAGRGDAPPSGHVDPGRVDLSLTLTGGEVRLIVADNGPGIPPGEHARVRERFYRLDRDQTRPGSGLGLSLVDAIALRHGGHLDLGDNQPGLRAELVLPLG